MYLPLPLFFLPLIFSLSYFFIFKGIKQNLVIGLISHSLMENGLWQQSATVNVVFVLSEGCGVRIHCGLNPSVITQTKFPLKSMEFLPEMQKTALLGSWQIKDLNLPGIVVPEGRRTATLTKFAVLLYSFQQQQM